MKATGRDCIIVAAAILGTPTRDGEILGARTDDGNPPYLLRWSDTGHQTAFFPGSDPHVDHPRHTTGTDAAPAGPGIPNPPPPATTSPPGTSTSISPRQTMTPQPTRSCTSDQRPLSTAAVKPTASPATMTSPKSAMKSPPPAPPYDISPAASSTPPPPTSPPSRGHPVQLDT